MTEKDQQDRSMGHVLFTLREERNLTLTQVAKAAGLPTETLSRIEAQGVLVQRVSLAQLCAIASVLGLTAWEVVKMWEEQ